jgi:hypothetical protein
VIAPHARGRKHVLQCLGSGAGRGLAFGVPHQAPPRQAAVRECLDGPIGGDGEGRQVRGEPGGADRVLVVGVDGERARPFPGRGLGDGPDVVAGACVPLRGARQPRAVAGGQQLGVAADAQDVVDVSAAGYERWLDTIEGKFNALQAIAPLIAAMPADGVARQVARVAGALQLTHAEVTTAVTDAVSARWSTTRRTSPPQAAQVAARPSRRAS